MIDTYICSNDKEKLAAFCAHFVNVIGPEQGRVALEASVDDFGNVRPAQPACGQVTKGYACVRFCEPVLPCEDIQVCGCEEGMSVLGQWA